MHIDEVMLAFLAADDAHLASSVSLGKANVTEDAVTIEYESSGVLEAVMALVAVDLQLFVHIYYTSIKSVIIIITMGNKAN